MDYYDLDAILNHVIRAGIDISPADRGEWAMFCCALKTLGYSEETFVNLSSCSPTEASKKWREEKNPSRYFRAPDNAKAKLIALAKAAGVELNAFRTFKGSFQKMPLNALTALNAQNGATSTPAAEPDAAPPPPPVYIAPEALSAMEARAKDTTLFLFLCRFFPAAEVAATMRRYRVGATPVFGDAHGLASAFPYINAEGNCVDVHLQPYEPDGHRRKDGYSQDWQLRREGKKERRGQWCLFGEHLLTDAAAPIGLVESEKTALICALYFPRYLWMATGSLSNLNARRCAALRGRDLYVFPDADGIARWMDKAKELHAEGFRVFFCGDTISRHAAAPKEDLGDIVLTAIKATRQ